MSLVRPLVRPLVSSLVGPLVGLGGASGPPVEIAAGNLRAWYNLQQSDLVFQDSALTTPAGDNDPIGALVDWYGLIEPLIQTTAANKPTKRDSSGIKYAEFDGAGDILAGATASTWKALHGPLGGGVYIVGEWTGTAASNTDFAGTYASTSLSAIGLRLRGQLTSTRALAAIGDGTTGANINSGTTSFPTDTKRVIMAIHDAPNTNIIARAWDNAAVTGSSSAVTYSSSDGTSLRVTSSLTSVFKAYEIVARSPILTPTELSDLLAYWDSVYSIS